MIRRVASAIVLILLIAASARAQTTTWAGRFYAGAAIARAGAEGADTARAELTRNATPSGDPFPLFSADLRRESATGADAWIGWRATRLFALEAGGSVSHPRLRASLGDDVEGALAVVASERLTQYVVEGSAIVPLAALRFAGDRARPYVRGGVGFLRELHERNTAARNGWTYHAGAGIDVGVSGRVGPFDGVALRGDARIRRRHGGIDAFDRARTSLAASAGILVYF